MKRGNIYLPIFSALKTIFPCSYDTPVLIYHAISNNKDIPGGIPFKIFKRHMDFFKQNQYEVVPLKRIGEMQIEKDEPERHCHLLCLTFDDGYEDFLNSAWSVLKDYNFPVALFLIVKQIGQKGYLSLAQIKEMLSSGLITIGSHTMEHRYLLELNSEQLNYEIKESKKILEESLGCSIDFFSYPWGGFSPRIEEIVKEAGYKAAFTTNQLLSRRRREKDNYCLKRMTMSSEDSFWRFLVKVSGFGYCFSRKIKIKDQGINIT